MADMGELVRAPVINSQNDTCNLADSVINTKVILSLNLLCPCQVMGGMWVGIFSPE